MTSCSPLWIRTDRNPPTWPNPSAVAWPRWVAAGYIAGAAKNQVTSMADVKLGEPFGLDGKIVEQINWNLALDRLIHDTRTDFIYAPIVPDSLV